MTVTRQDSHSELVEMLDGQVRERVRSDGVDPQRDAGLVRRIAEDVVRRHDERSLTGAVVPIADPDGVVGELIARVSGFGPLQPFLDDPEVEEIWINDPSRVFIARRGRHELTNLMLSAAQVHELVERMLKSSGRRIDLSQPFVDAMLPEGHRLHVVLEGISRGFSAVNIRKFVVRASRMSDLVELGSLSQQAAAFLDASIRAGLNVLVAGGTQAGKTTFLNCLAAAIPGGDRVISAEEVFELRFNHPDWVPMQTRQAGLEGTGEIALRDLVKEALRMRPSRVVVGEVRAEECLDLLLALNAGLPGIPEGVSIARVVPVPQSKVSGSLRPSSRAASASSSSSSISWPSVTANARRPCNSRTRTCSLTGVASNTCSISATMKRSGRSSSGTRSSRTETVRSLRGRVSSQSTRHSPVVV